jgi:hypothetical protein
MAQEIPRMAAIMPTSRTELSFFLRRWRRIAAAAALIPAAVVAASLWLTEPLEERRPTIVPTTGVAEVDEAALARESTTAEAPAWPEGLLEGDPAKRRLLDYLRAAAARLEVVDGYTATFRKQERIGDTLGPEQVMEMKLQHRPFAVYLKLLRPQAGKEVIYAEGRHDNKMIAHAGGWSRRLVPRLAVAPDSALALAENRHPITEAGLAHLTRKLIGFREMDLDDAEAVTILDRVAEDGRLFYRSLHTHPTRRPERPFARIEILYDPDNGLPVRITSFDWPEPGDGGNLKLAERYAYDDLKLDAPLSDLDFDPANPAYEFRRF